MRTDLNDIDRKLLNIIQAEFPLNREPFLALGMRLNISGEEVLRRIERLKAEGIIRQIGPVCNAQKLGYQTTLVGMRVPVEQLSNAAQVIGAHPGISHGYERDNDFNFWFTLAMPNREDIGNEVQKLATKIEAKATINLPAVRVFKIGFYLDIAGDNWTTPDTSSNCATISYKDSDLSPNDRAIVNELQQDLPLIERPFDLTSARLSMDVSDLLNRCQSLMRCGIIRRFGASLRHTSLGFTANVMACWKVPPVMVETTGKKIAALREVSHCYERKTSPLWPYNLFAMIHASKKQTCQDRVDKLSQETELGEYILLFSTREFKKVRVRYLV